MRRFLLGCITVHVFLTAFIPLAAVEKDDGSPISPKMDADTTAADSTVDAPPTPPVSLGPIIPYSGVETDVHVSWWPLDMGRILERMRFRTDSRGLIAAPAFPGGGAGLESPGYLWMGIPWTGIQEIGGDATTLFPLSTSRIVISNHPSSVTGGRKTIYFHPLMDPIISPHTRIQTLRGSRQDSWYGLDFGTRATGLISSEVAVGYRENIGDRSNSGSAMKQYDWRVDMQPPIIGPCTILNHYTEIDRGVPGPHPSYWDDSVKSDSLFSARYWATERGYGTDDAMWQQGNEILSTNLLVVRFTQQIRDEIPVHLSIARDRASIETSVTNPVIIDSTAIGIPFDGDCTTDRTAFSARMTFSENDIDSIWSTVSVERIKRESRIESGGDSVSIRTWDETNRRAVLALGAQIGSTEAIFSYVRGEEHDYSGALTSEKTIGAFALSGEITYGWDERRLRDILIWQRRSYPEPPHCKGDIGVVAARARYTYGGGTAEGGVRYGRGRDVWGWCFDDSIPPGEMMRWGPSDPVLTGVEFSIHHALLTWLRFNGDIEYAAWRLKDDRVPGVPDLYASVSLGFDYPIQRRAHPHGELRLRHSGNRFWGPGETFGLDSSLSLDGYLAVDIGDFTVLLMGKNLTGTTYEDIPGYPILQRSVHFGFHWTFWD